MNKKNILLTIALLSISFVVYANNEQDFFDVAKSAYLNIIPFYQNMQSCTPYQYTDADGILYKIYGKERNTCHIQEGDRHCYFPQGIDQKYASNSLTIIRKTISDLENGIFSYSSDEHPEMRRLENTYCKY